MRQIYEITDTVRNSISSNGITNKVTFGDLLQVDLDKTTMFPLAHITIGTSVFSDSTITIPLNILFIDIVDVNKEPTDDDIFYGNDNLQDVLNTQFQAANLIQSELRRGDLFDSLYQVLDDVSADPFLDNFENQLAGWSVDLNIVLPNNDISVC
jgi:hypothetical protein